MPVGLVMVYYRQDQLILYTFFHQIANESTGGARQAVPHRQEPILVDRSGDVLMPQKPGIGVEIDEQALAKYQVSP